MAKVSGVVHSTTVGRMWIVQNFEGFHTREH